MAEGGANVEKSTSTTKISEIISLTHVDKVYPPNQHALRDIQLRVSPGEFIFIAGASGAGKSSLLKMLFAEERPNRGEIRVAGRNLNLIKREEISLLRREMGVIFQDYKLLETRTVLENVAFTLEVLGVCEVERRELAESLLEVVGLKEKLKNYPTALSGGEQQRVAVARALINRPKIILADEPTGNLDPDMTRAVFNLLIEANTCGSTVLIATHNLQLIEEINQRTLVLDRGRIIGDFERPRG